MGKACKITGFYSLTDEALTDIAMPTSNVTISLIVPALNEEAVVGTVLEDIYSQAKNRFVSFEIIAINDCSSDSTGRIMDEFAARRPGMRVLHNATNLGLGGSFRRGLANAQFDYEV